MDDLGRHADRPAAFHRKIVHHESGRNPRFSGGIEMQLSQEYQNIFIGHRVAEIWQVSNLGYLLSPFGNDFSK
jgi:hypothetical protein